MDSILALLYCKQSRSVQDVEFSHKFCRSLPDYGQHRTPPSILCIRMPHPFPREVCFSVVKFGLNCLRRSPSSSPNTFGGFHHMHACWHADSSRLGHLHTPIDRSSKSDSSTMFHTHFATSGRSDHTNYAVTFTQYALGQSWVPISPISNGCSVIHTTTCVFFSLMPPEHLLQNQIYHRHGPKTPRPCGPPVVTVLVTLLWRLLRMLRRIFSTCRLPSTD